MKNINQFLALMCLCFSCSSQGAIMSSDVRSEKLKAIRDLVSAEVVQVEEPLLSVAPSPFSPDLGLKVEEELVEQKVALSDEELLGELSEYVNPTGIFMFSGEFYLIFKEKKLKVGSKIGIKYEGDEYRVVITEITGSTYRIQRGDAELQLKLK